MSIESEMSHQRFRFLLQSGVWHLFFLLSHSCLVQHVLSPQMHGHITVSFFIRESIQWLSLPFFFPPRLMLSLSLSLPLPVNIFPLLLACGLFFFFPLYFIHPSLVLLSVQHSNPGHAGPFPVASLHNANPTSPTSASMAGAHAHRSPASPIIGPIELIPSVTNPENLPCLPEIPPIQVCLFQTNNVSCFFRFQLSATLKSVSKCSE